jgi:hypothetical protein
MLHAGGGVFMGCDVQPLVRTSAGALGLLVPLPGELKNKQAKPVKMARVLGLVVNVADKRKQTNKQTKPVEKGTCVGTSCISPWRKKQTSKTSGKGTCVGTSCICPWFLKNGDLKKQIIM